MMKNYRTLWAVVFSTCYALNTQADWKQWRGPTGQGHAEGKIPAEWSETQNISWKTPIPGKGWSSPVIEGNHIWLTAAHEIKASEEEKEERLKSNTGGQPLVVLSSVKLHAVCIDKDSGELLHDFEIIHKKNPQWTHKLNSYASPTPVIEGGKLYCHFGSYGTACVDTRTTKVIWRNQDLYVHHENGPGSTPIIWDDKLIFHMDGSDQQYVVALNKKDGGVAWRTDRTGEMNPNPQLKKSYGTPLILDTNGRPILYSPAADWLYTYDPNTGKELNKLNYGMLGFSIVPRPVAGHGLIYVITSFMRPQMLAIDYLSSNKPSIKWKWNRGVSNQPSAILVGDEIYFVSDSAGMVTCLDAHTGKEHWRERIGGNYSASPLQSNGRIYFHSREGKTTVIEAGKEFKVVSINQLDGQLMASAAVDDQALFLRSDKSLYRIERKRD
ncbi:PQQ-binding-like beta-propeller repeat protein [Verrucomicrobia bacterium]|nr:PQQ-binding-like beta-propeller repeat protein [Verrucomicrobiota bacterium]